ncbi:MAG: metal ABC transporter permease [Pseudomonadota bacterium]
MGDTPGLADLLAALPLLEEAIVTGTVAGLVLGYLGVHVLTRRMVFVAATLSQTAALGVALAFWLAMVLDSAAHPTLGAALASLATALLLSLPARRLRLSQESVMALLWLLSAALAVLAGDRIAQEAHDVGAILFGTAVMVPTADMVAVLAVALPALGLALWLQPLLVFTGFDPDGARVQGLPVRALDLLLLGLITLVVAAATRAMGALPVFAFSVLPAMAALLLASGLRTAFLLAAALGAAAGGLGYLLAFFLDLPVGAAQAGLAALFVAAALPVRWLRGGQ